MDWNAPMFWWQAAGVLVAAALATGTLCLLMVAVGCVAGAVAAHAGLGSTGQVATAALLGAACTARVPYRGAAWNVRYAGGGTPAPGEHVIVVVQGNQLRVAPAARR